MKRKPKKIMVKNQKTKAEKKNLNVNEEKKKKHWLSSKE